MTKALTQKPEKPRFQPKVLPLPARRRKSRPIPGTREFDENYSHEVPADQAGLIWKSRGTLTV